MKTPVIDTYVPYEEDKFTTLKIPIEYQEKNLRITSINFFEDTDEHGVIYLKGNLKSDVTYHAFLF